MSSKKLRVGGQNDMLKRVLKASKSCRDKEAASKNCRVPLSAQLGLETNDFIVTNPDLQGKSVIKVIKGAKPKTKPPNTLLKQNNNLHASQDNSPGRCSRVINKQLFFTGSFRDLGEQLCQLYVASETVQVFITPATKKGKG